MHDNEATYLLLEEIQNLRCTVRRFGVFFVCLTFLALGSLGFGYLRYKTLEEALVASVLDQSRADLISALKQIEPVRWTPSVSSERFINEPSAPPMFPTGTQFVPDNSSPKGYRATMNR